MDSNKGRGGTTDHKLHAMKEADLHSDVSGAADESTATVIEGSSQDLRYKENVYTYTIAKYKDFYGFVKTLNLELVTFIFMFGYIIRSVSSMTMMMEKICLVNLNYPDEVCSSLHLEKYAEEKLKVETMANNYHIGHTLISALPSAALGCFIGPWSDKYSRKIPMIVALIGIILDDFGGVLCAYYLKSNVAYFLIPPMFTGLSGGFVSIITIVNCYVSDLSATGSRTIKYALLEMAFGLGAPLGLLAGGFIFDKHGYVSVYVTSGCCHLFGLFWAVYALPETRGIGNKDSWRVKLRHFFSCQNLIDGFKAATKKRPNDVRKQLWFLLLAMMFTFFAFSGATNVTFTYAHHHYYWENRKYSTVSAIFATMALVVMMISVPLFSKVFKFKDTTLGIIGSASMFSQCIVVALAYKEGLFYLGNFLGLFGSLTNLAARSRISKIVPPEDTGKIFVVLSTFQATIPLMASAAIVQLFNHTVGITPDPTYSFLSVFLLATLMLFIMMIFMPPAKCDKEEEEEQHTENELENQELEEP